MKNIKGRFIRAAIICFITAGVASSAYAEAKHENVGTDDYKPEVGGEILRSVLMTKAADVSTYANRGTIKYTIPSDMGDGIPVADANDFCDISPIIKYANEVELKNQEVKNDPDLRKIKWGVIDSILIAKNGKLIVEEYFANGRVDVPHYQMSITKSMLGLSLMKAIDLGLINSDQDLVLDYFPEMDKSKLAAGADQLKLRDVFSMNSGIRAKPHPWIEKFKKHSKPYRDAVEEYKNSMTIENHVFRILSNSEPIAASGTAEYKYQGSDPSISSHILYNKTGMTMTEFLREHVFGPMGISKVAFQSNACGLDLASAGLVMRSRDMMKIGLMAKDGGVWNGKRIISEKMMNVMMSPHAHLSAPHKYGYYWWTHSVKINDREFVIQSCRGAGGQLILISKDLDLVVVITSFRDNPMKGLNIYGDRILPVFVKE